MLVHDSHECVSLYICVHIVYVYVYLHIAYVSKWLHTCVYDKPMPMRTQGNVFQAPGQQKFPGFPSPAGPGQQQQAPSPTPPGANPYSRGPGYGAGYPRPAANYQQGYQ